MREKMDILLDAADANRRTTEEIHDRLFPAMPCDAKNPQTGPMTVEDKLHALNIIIQDTRNTINSIMCKL
jgi:hypothetical protein